MKVSSLIKLLEQQDPDATIVLQTDSEGNGYGGLAGAAPVINVDDEYFDPNWTASECGLEVARWGKLKATKSRQCVVLYPN